MLAKRFWKIALSSALSAALTTGLCFSVFAGETSSSTNAIPVASGNLAELVGCWLLSSNADNSASAQGRGELAGAGGFQDNALILDGGHVTFDASSSLNISGSLSFCLWFNPEKSDGIMRLLGKFQVEGDNREYCVFLGADNRLWVFLSDNGTAETGHAILRATETASVVNGQWQHLAVTWDATAGADGLSIYLNGKFSPTLSAADAQISQLHVGDSRLVLGSYDVLSGATNTFHGALARFLLFRGVLAAPEVAAIYGLGRDLVAGNKTSARAALPPPDATAPVAAPGARTAALIPPNQIIFVHASTGSDAYDGLAATFVSGTNGPKKTISAALSMASSGGTICLTGGTFHENVNLCGTGIRLTASGQVRLCKP